MKKLLSLVGLQALLGMSGVGYLASPTDAQGSRDLSAGLERIVALGPEAAIGSDVTKSLAEQYRKLSPDLEAGEVSEQLKGMLEKAGSITGGLAGGLMEGAASGAGNAVPRQGSESTVLFVETAEGRQVKWQAPTQPLMAPEEELRQVLVGAARANGSTHRAERGQTITITGEGKDLKMTVSVR